jgi:hypothetical protein
MGEKQKPRPAILGVVFLFFVWLFFGQDTFILFAMLLILLGFCSLGKKPQKRR